MTEFEMEKAKLDDTLAIVQTVLSEEKDALAKLYKEFIGDREELWRMADIKNIHLINLILLESTLLIMMKKTKSIQFTLVKMEFHEMPK